MWRKLSIGAVPWLHVQFMKIIIFDSTGFGHMSEHQSTLNVEELDAVFEWGGGRGVVVVVVSFTETVRLWNVNKYLGESEQPKYGATQLPPPPPPPPPCVRCFHVSIPPAVRPTLIRQTDMGSLTWSKCTNEFLFCLHFFLAHVRTRNYEWLHSIYCLAWKNAHGKKTEARCFFDSSIWCISKIFEKSKPKFNQKWYVPQLKLLENNWIMYKFGRRNKMVKAYIYMFSKSRSCKQRTYRCNKWHAYCLLVAEIIQCWFFASADPLWPCIKVKVIETSMG